MEKTSIEEKAKLRAEFRTKRLPISAVERDARDEAIAGAVAGLPEVKAAKVIFAYLSRSGEVDTKRLVQSFLQQHKRVITPSPDIKALPHDGLFRVTPRPDMDGHFPPVLCRESRVEEVDVILVPGIAWDRNGYRIGFGGGYFDRLLEMARPDCLKIGLAYELQVTDMVPREPWDQSVDVLVTENGASRISRAG